MKRHEYEFDDKEMVYRKVRVPFFKPVLTVLKLLLVSLTLFLLLYTVLASFISTDTEKRLRAEIRAYERVYPLLEPREKVLEESLESLRSKDDKIYRTVFHNPAPSVDPMGSRDILFGADTIPDTKIVTYTTAKADRLCRQAGEVDAAFAEIYRKLAGSDSPLPPMIMPVDDISYPQTGASTGQKLNPFLNVDVAHDGIDFLVPTGTTVKATADGTVTSVQKSGKGAGNCVTIRHAGGYETRYLHLSQVKVSAGQSVRKGKAIGTSGMSGNAFAPHLHYEVILDGKAMDPVNYLFASVSPEEYSNMLYMSVNTRQSMD